MLRRFRSGAAFADLAEEHWTRRGFGTRMAGISGKSFRAGTDLTVGGPATLLKNILEERNFDVVIRDLLVGEGPCPFDQPGVYSVAINHQEFAAPPWTFPENSVVIDPWRFIKPQSGIELILVGVGDAVHIGDTRNHEYRVNRGALRVHSWLPSALNTSFSYRRRE